MMSPTAPTSIGRPGCPVLEQQLLGADEVAVRPVRPTALPPAWLMGSRRPLFTWPPSTISTTSMVSSSVTRMPWMNSPFLPTRVSMFSICGPPPLHHHHVHAVTSFNSTTSREALLQVLVGHRVAAVLHDDGLAVETLDGAGLARMPASWAG